MKFTRLCTPIASLVLLASATHASAGVWFQNIIDPYVPTGYLAFEIVWTGDNDWTSSAMLLNLYSGSVYNQHPAGSNSAPSSFLISLLPQVEFDTYVGIINDSTGGIAGGAGDLGGGALSLDAPQVSVSWYNTDPDDIGIKRIGMLTLSNDVQGTVSTISDGQMSSGVVDSGLLGAMVPVEVELIPTQPDVIPGYTAYEVYYNGFGYNDWRYADFSLELTQGTIYNDPAGSDVAPTSADIANSPDLAYDTYLGIIDDDTASIVGGNYDGSIPLEMDSDSILAYWKNWDSENRGLVKIGNITLSNDAVGTWSLNTAGQTFTGVIPEPTTFALMSLAGAALLRRR